MSAHIYETQTFIITSVPNPYGSGNIYAVDGVNAPILYLVRGGVYTFNQSDSTNTNHPIAFKNGAGASYTTGVISTGTPGQSGAQTVFTVPNDAPNDLRYYCTVHGNGMGNVIVVSGDNESQVNFNFGKLSSVFPINTRINTLLYKSPNSTLVNGKVYINNKDSSPVKIRVGLSTGGVVDFNSSGYVVYNKELQSGESYETENLYIKDGESIIVNGSSSNIRFTLLGEQTSNSLLNSGFLSGYNITNTSGYEEIYEVPQNTQVNSNIIVCNKDSFPVRVKISIGDSEGDHIEYNHKINPNSNLEKSGVQIGPGQKVYVKSESLNSNFVITGVRTNNLITQSENGFVGINTENPRFALEINPIGASGTSLLVNGDARITGALSKGSGSFKIDHPLEIKKDTHHLVHSFIEGPQADLIYRGKSQLVNGTIVINIDDFFGMTEGTFVSLCRDVQSFTTNETGWDLVKSSIYENIFTIESQNNNSEDIISWLIIGERQDMHMYNTSWTDENGKVILEPEKQLNYDANPSTESQSIISSSCSIHN